MVHQDELMKATDLHITVEVGGLLTLMVGIAVRLWLPKKLPE